MVVSWSFFVLSPGFATVTTEISQIVTALQTLPLLVLWTTSFALQGYLRRIVYISTLPSAVVEFPPCRVGTPLDQGDQDSQMRALNYGIDVEHQ